MTKALSCMDKNLSITLIMSSRNLDGPAVPLLGEFHPQHVQIV